MKKLIIKCIIILPLFLIAVSSYAYKNEPVGKTSSNTAVRTKAAGCGPATTTENMQFNNVKSLIETGGSLWQNRATSDAAYFVPKNQNVSVLYAGALWMGGRSPDQQLKLAAVRYRAGNDFWPGPLTENTADVSAETCSAYDKFFVTYRLDAVRHRAWAEATFGEGTPIDGGYTTPAYYDNYPAHGNEALGQSRYLAPFYDFDGDGFYDPSVGDYPKYDVANEFDCRTRDRFDEVPLFGDETYYWIFNDKGNIHSETQGDPIGMEIRAQAFSFATTDEINNMTFYNYTLINQGTQTLTQTYFGQYADPDIGNSTDDYVGCDVARGLGYCYNGDPLDEPISSSAGWGVNPPAVGIDFFEGPYQDSDGIDNPNEGNITIALDSAGIPYSGLGLGYGDGIVDNERFGMRKFIYYNISGAGTNDPDIASEYYNYMTGFWKDGAPLTFGGNGHDNNSGVPCDYMFPGDSDPLRWGTLGADGGNDNWSEFGEATPPGDRRFIQSAGPFTLEPGQWNNITVGVVYGRAFTGSSFESVQQVLAADDKAQALFDNCFEAVPGPDAPLLSIVELENKLVLTIDNPTSISNNTHEIEYDVSNAGFDPSIPEETSDGTALSEEDRAYKFQGYQIYQLADETVSAADLEDDEKARLIFQCDIEDDVTDLFNFEVNLGELGGLIEVLPKVQGANSGIQHSFEVTTDAFATGSPLLVNYKSYYFIAIAYASNNYEEYQYASESTDAIGQDIQYLASQKSAFGGGIESVVGIPHRTDSELGNSGITYGDGVVITQHEGAGNGTNVINVSAETENKILADNFVEELTFMEGQGPVNIKLIDPVRVEDIDFELKLVPYPGDDDYDDDSTYWVLNDLTNGIEVDIFKQAFIHENEYLIEDYGISIEFSFYEYHNEEYSISANRKSTDFLEGSIEIDEPTKLWYVGIPDEESFSELNWIRIGNFEAGTEGTDAEQYYDDYPLNATQLDDTYETVLNGTWAPLYHTTLTNISVSEDDSSIGNEVSHIGPRRKATGVWNSAPLASVTSDMIYSVGLNNVDIVFTADKSKWTRSPVIEMQVYTELAEGNTKKLYLRSHASVDKNGKVAGEPGYNSSEGDMTGPTGMGWFPGYAIDIGTGERLNIAFGEDSWNEEDNGNDMLWNPNSVSFGPLGQARAGGQHWIYVFKNTQNEQGSNQLCPRYDKGQFIYDNLINADDGSLKIVYSSCTWVGSALVSEQNPLLSVEDGLIPETTRIRLRVAKKYKKYSSTQVDFNNSNNSENDWNPLYTFSTKSGASISESAGVATEDINEEILETIQVVPNPYYAYSQYETSKLDNLIKFTNLPQECTITIYNVSGTLIRQYHKADPLTFLDWDLKNANNIPISSGTYIMHIEVPGIGERVLKWFGVMRPVDLDNF